MRISTLCLLLTLAAPCCFAQSPAPLNSGQIIDDGIKLHDQQQFQKAVEAYRKVPRYDTNYARALYEMSVSFERDSNFTAALQACEEGLQQDDKEYELAL